MKVLVLDCINSSSALVLEEYLNKFADGIRSTGHEVEIIKVSSLDIKPCYCCTSQSSFQPDEKCRCADDMNNLYPEFHNSHSWVFAAHINSSGAVNYLKNLLDRMEPLFQPMFMLDDSAGSMPPDNKLEGNIIFISSYEPETEKIAKNISDYIDSMSMLFSKKSMGSILIENTDLNPENFIKMFDAGKTFVTR